MRKIMMLMVVLSSWLAVSGTAAPWNPPDCRFYDCSK